MAISDLKAGSRGCPSSLGVYVFSNAAGETLYVGKARVLRDRVRSYLGGHGASPRVDALLREAAGLDVIVTDSVVEALALENRLIKQRHPRFNILLRDDKTYPYLQLDRHRAGAARAGRADRRTRRQRLRRPVHARRRLHDGRWR